jgi:hypothetical protein
MDPFAKPAEKGTWETTPRADVDLEAVDGKDEEVEEDGDDDDDEEERPRRALKPATATAAGWRVDTRDLSGRPFSLVVPNTRLPDLQFGELIGYGVDGCVYGGTYRDAQVAVKVGLLLDTEIENVTRASALHLAPRVLTTAVLSDVVFGDCDGKRIEGGDDREVGVIVMERYDGNLEQLCADPAWRAAHGPAVWAAARALLNEAVPNALLQHNDLKLQNLVVRCGSAVEVRLVDYVDAQFGSCDDEVGPHTVTRESVCAESAEFLAAIEVALATGVPPRWPYDTLVRRTSPAPSVPPEGE